MDFRIESINHVCLVVRDLDAANDFYMGTLGLRRHDKVSSWLHLTENSTLHLVHVPEATKDDSLYHEIQHFALQITSLREALKHLLSHRLEPFQMDFGGNTKPLASASDSLDFGIGTIFVRDPDGNLVEFVQLGEGIFKDDPS